MVSSSVQWETVTMQLGGIWQTTKVRWNSAHPTIVPPRHLILIALSWVLLSGPAWAHPFHVSIAEAELKSRPGRMEIGLRVNPVDLEQILRERSKRNIDLESTQGVDKLVLDYLRETIVFRRSKTGKPLKIKWVGKEISIKHAWIYFEVPIEPLGGQLFITHRLFFELLRDQVNTINFKQGRSVKTLSFSRDHGTRQIEIPIRT